MKKVISIVLLLAMCGLLAFGGKALDKTREAAEVPAPEEEITGLPEVKEQEYIHPEDGYYCLLEDGVEYELKNQVAGTCWVCTSTCAMNTAYQLKYGKKIDVFNQLDFVAEVFDEDEVGGVYGGGKDSGGCAIFVVNELSLGFLDGYVLDGAIRASEWSMDEYKEGIKKYGALYIGIPDTHRSYIRKKDGYTTLNWPDAETEDYDHSIAVIGWDDHFPKEYFAEEASRDGAWITYNSNRSGDYYYVSYDTPFDQINDAPYFMSVSTDYAKVATHDGGMWTEETAGEGETVAAGVFHEEGTLSAVGTFVNAENADITIQVMTPDLKEELCTETFHADHTGYYVFSLSEPMEVKDYAIAVTYPDGAPVEGENQDWDWMTITAFSKEGESFILLDGVWLDLSLESTWEKVGFTTNNACIRALYVE